MAPSHSEWDATISYHELRRNSLAQRKEGVPSLSPATESPVVFRYPSQRVRSEIVTKLPGTTMKYGHAKSVSELAHLGSSQGLPS